MKFISWNVNGLRACASKGFADSFRQLVCGEKRIFRDCGIHKT